MPLGKNTGKIRREDQKYGKRRIGCLATLVEMAPEVVRQSEIDKGVVAGPNYALASARRGFLCDIEHFMGRKFWSN